MPLDDDEKTKTRRKLEEVTRPRFSLSAARRADFTENPGFGQWQFFKELAERGMEDMVDFTSLIGVGVLLQILRSHRCRQRASGKVGLVGALCSNAITHVVCGSSR